MSRIGTGGLDSARVETPVDFVAWWLAELRETPPLGYRLRQAFPWRWVRFHSLPGSNRYPASPEEMTEIHRRHDTVGAALLGPDEEVIVVRSGFSATEEPTRPEVAGGAWPDDGFVYARTWSTDEHDPESDFVHSWIAPAIFRPDAFHHVWSLVANDVIEGVLLVSPERRCVLAPYDGGMDVIGADIFVIDSLRRDFREWVAPDPSGL